MKRLLIALSSLALLIAACAAPAAPADLAVTAASPASLPVSAAATATPYAAAYLSVDYADAASLRNQLAFGTLQLESSPEAVTAEQAQALLPLWQAIVALNGAETTATEELTAVQDQIAEALTPAQLRAIAGQQITNAALTAFYAERGVVMPTPAPGVTKVPGQGKDLSEEAKAATHTAAEALGTTAGAGQAAKTLLFNLVIELLTARAAQ